MAPPRVISKLDGLDDGDEVRVETDEGHEVEGTVECPHVDLDADYPRNREAFVPVLISVERADELKSVWCQVTLSAYRGRDGWTDLDATYVDKVDDNGDTESSASLGVVETVECID